jgi:hypothetical protein
VTEDNRIPEIRAASQRLVKAANDVLGNDTGRVLDCSTAGAIAAAIRELAERPDKWWHQEELDEVADELDRADAEWQHTEGTNP